ncbi:Uncharacterised protein [Clostridioides difficile]|nr:Uncharacterised protein [Clostridioides difficile]VII02074.1 Uncharacterised protein [Clostridioides difficile]
MISVIICTTARSLQILECCICVSVGNAKFILGFYINYVVCKGIALYETVPPKSMFYINYVVCKDSCISNFKRYTRRFILTMWYVKWVDDPEEAALLLRFYINYVVCKELYSIREFNTIKWFYINYVVCKADSANATAEKVVRFYINYVVCKVSFFSHLSYLYNKFYINYVVCKDM